MGLLLIKIIKKAYTKYDNINYHEYNDGKLSPDLLMLTTKIS